MDNVVAMKTKKRVSKKKDTTKGATVKLVDKKGDSPKINKESASKIERNRSRRNRNTIPLPKDKYAEFRTTKGTRPRKGIDMDVRQYHTMKDVRKVGWVCEPLYFGTLESVDINPQRTIFVFCIGATRFIAYSFAGHARDNARKLQVGEAYVIEGDRMEIRCYRKKFFSSYHFTCRYTVRLEKIGFDKKNKPESTEPPRTPDKFALKKVTAKTKQGIPFEEQVQNVEIVSGTLYRYLGCKGCPKSLHHPDESGKYCCSSCGTKNGPNERRVRLSIQNLEIKDSNGHTLPGLVCFEKDVISLLGQSKVKQISGVTDSPGDGLPLQEVTDSRMIDCTIDGKAETVLLKSGTPQFSLRLTHIRNIRPKSQLHFDLQHSNQSINGNVSSSSRNV